MASDNSNSLPEDADRAAGALWQPLAERLLAQGWMLATAESCTGGLIAGGCTSLAGSSQWFERGFVSYSNGAKHDLLGVDPALIAAHGAVSAEVAQAMARGAIAHSAAQAAVAVTGVAGPGGGTEAKPVGLVWFGFALPNGTVQSESQRFAGDRAAVRAATVRHARERLLALLPSA
jgi:nicotinamide-nucleotide amidase